MDDIADTFNISVQEVKPKLEKCRQILWGIRQSRPKPHKDDKIITSWNGLMISALAKSSRSLSDSHMLDLAKSSAAFIKENLYDPSTRGLLRSYRGDSPSDISGFADDYCFMIMGLLDLYEASFDVKYLQWALDLQNYLDTHFWDAEHGGYFSGLASDSSVLIRMKDDHDGAEPTPNSVAVTNLLRLDSLVSSTASQYRSYAEKILLDNAVRLTRIPRSLAYMSSGISIYNRGLKKVLSLEFVLK
jgi:uncharacterized protein YyaL (SSP411 family)